MRFPRLSIETTCHPLVSVHPKTGEKALNCNSSWAIGIEGMPEDEAMLLIAFLTEFITWPVMTCRLRWKPGTLALRDDRLCLHQAVTDYDGFRREIYRCTIAA